MWIYAIYDLLVPFLPFTYFHTKSYRQQHFWQIYPWMSTVATQWMLFCLHVTHSPMSRLWRQDQRKSETCGQLLPGSRRGQTASVITMISSQSEEQWGSCGSGCCGSHLTGIDAAREELVQLYQFVWGDVELERDTAEGIIWSNL